ncbi:MAG: efflux RND transporter periplasmic adaptor subunit, partial [Nitrospirales bacterium]|nr:efflux RND transporter periplasmic adaptor subunit [Nitrospirales bacterium]
DIVTPIGAAAAAKAAVVTLADMRSLQVQTDVSESNIHQVSPGQPCEITLDAFPSERFRGKVHMIVPTADRTKATVLVKVAFTTQDPRILPEMSAKVAFLSREVRGGEESPITVIPQKAVMEKDSLQSVYIIRKKRVFRTPVETGRKMGEAMEVLKGLKTGDRVVVAPLERLKDRSSVKTKE